MGAANQAPVGRAFLANFGTHSLHGIEYAGEPCVLAFQQADAMGATRSQFVDHVRNLVESGEMVEGKHVVRIEDPKAVEMISKAMVQRDPGNLPGSPIPASTTRITLLTRHGAIRAAMTSRAPRAKEFRDWAEDVLFNVLTTGKHVEPDAGRSAHDHLTARELRLLGDRYWRAGQRDKALELYDAAERAHGLPARKVSPPRPQPPQQLPLPTPRPVEVAVPAPTTILTVLAAIEDRAEREAATWLVSQWDAGQSPATRSFGDRFGFGYDRANRLRTWLAGEASRLGGRVPPARTKPPRTSAQAEPVDDLRRTVTASPARMEIKSLVMAILDASGPDGARRSIPQLAAAAGMHEKTARKHLADLVEANAVAREDDREFKAPMWRVSPDDLSAKLGAFAKDGRGGNRPGMRAVGDA